MTAPSFYIVPYLALIAMSALVSDVAAQEREWIVDGDASELTYTGSHPLHSWTGTSKEVEGRMRLDPFDPSGAEIELRVSIESFDSGNSNRDSNMMEVVEVWLWPEIVFTSESLSIERWDVSGDTGTGAWMVQGILAFHGESKIVSVVADAVLNRDKLEVQVSFPVELDQFKIKRPKLMLKRIGNEIRIEGKILLRQTSG